MAGRASDLSEHDRRRLLDTIRQRIGDENYARLIELQGEDRVIETMMAAARSSPAPKAPDPMVWIWFAVLWGVISVASGLIGGKLYVAGCVLLSPLPMVVVIAVPSAIGDWFAARFGKTWNWPVTIVAIAVALLLLYLAASALEGRVPREILGTYFLAASIAAAGPALFVHYISEWLSGTSRRAGSR